MTRHWIHTAVLAVASFAGVAGAASFNPVGQIAVTQATANAFYSLNRSGAAISINIPGYAEAGFNGLAGSACDAAGNLYLAEKTSRIFKFTPDGTLSTFATLPRGSNPGSLVVDPAGNVLTACVDGSIYRFTPTGTASLFATLPNRGPGDMEIDSNGNLFTSYSTPTANYIVKTTPLGISSTFDSLSGSGLYGLAIDADNSVYAATAGDGRITKFTQPLVITQAGNESTYATLSASDGIRDIEFSAAGDLYVTAPTSQRVYTVDARSGTIARFANLLDDLNTLALPIPEPASLTLLAFGGLTLRRRRA